ncbi:hypothetical protein JS80_08615 [Anoxybacillus sp. KU2-6(11)]|nr:hypothetical protein JS80_08615 [Anoxybacillus sp. KU2-6(11)]
MGRCPHFYYIKNEFSTFLYEKPTTSTVLHDFVRKNMSNDFFRHFVFSLFLRYHVIEKSE